jgi:hypothetical protein
MLALAMLAALPAIAHHPDLETSFKVDERTMVPGAVLEPTMGYVLKVLKSDSDRHVVQIFNEDGKNMITTFLGVSDDKSGTQTGFSFMDSEVDGDKVVREWFNSEWGGLKFVYSEQEARRIGQHSSEAVLWTNNRITADSRDMGSIQVSSTQPQDQSRSGSLGELARNDTADLPRTAGELPLLALTGLVFLTAGLTLRFAMSRR